MSWSSWSAHGIVTMGKDIIVKWNHGSKRVILTIDGYERQFIDALAATDYLGLKSRSRLESRDLLGIPRSEWSGSQSPKNEGGAPSKVAGGNGSSTSSPAPAPTPAKPKPSNGAPPKEPGPQGALEPSQQKAQPKPAPGSKNEASSIAEAKQILEKAKGALNDKQGSPTPRALGSEAPLASDVQKVGSPKDSLVSAAEELVLWVWSIRNRIKVAQAAGHRTRRVAGTRMIQAGIRLLSAGVRLHHVKSRLLVGWNPDEIEKFVGSKHAELKFGDIVTEGSLLIEAGFQNIFFVGPPGCGKTTLAAKLAEKLNLKFEAIPCNEELPSSSFYGRMIADGSFVGTAFTDIFENGGVFLFDEIFKMAPTVSVSLNMALANGYFYNSAAKRRMVRHDSCYIIGASNSFGLGSAQFGTDAPQDPAFLDRFTGAAVVVDYDERFEMELATNVKPIIAKLDE